MTTEPHVVESAVRSLAQQSAGDLRASDMEPEAVSSAVDVRYVGQSHELTVDYEPGDGWEALTDRFHELHARRNGFARPQDSIEAVTIRASALGAPALAWSDLPPVRPTGDPGRRIRQTVVGRHTLDALVVWRPALAPGAEVVGPAVIEEPQATTFLGRGERATVHETGALEVEW